LRSFAWVWNVLRTKQFLSLRQTGKLISKFDLIAELSGHGKKAGINQDVLAEQAKAVHRAFTALAFRGAGQAKDEISSA